MPEKNQMVASRTMTIGLKFLLQVAFSPYVNHSINLKVAESGCTRHTIELEALRKVGRAIITKDISEHRKA